VQNPIREAAATGTSAHLLPLHDGHPEFLEADHYAEHPLRCAVQPKRLLFGGTTTPFGLLLSFSLNIPRKLAFGRGMWASLRDVASEDPDDEFMDSERRDSADELM
jgi:hypothetical protein